MRLKAGVKVGGLQPEMLLAVMIVQEILRVFNIETVITSGLDGVHSKNSKHYVGRAVDIRTRDIRPDTLPGIAQELQSRLGGEYYVLLEPTHIHIQFNGGK